MYLLWDEFSKMYLNSYVKIKHIIKLFIFILVHGKRVSVSMHLTDKKNLNGIMRVVYHQLISICECMEPRTTVAIHISISYLFSIPIQEHISCAKSLPKGVPTKLIPTINLYPRKYHILKFCKNIHTI